MMQFDSRATRSLAALVLGLALAATGCQTLDPYTNEPETSKATKGAAIGAAAGAGIQVLRGGDRKDLIVAAGIGALAGGAVGYYMDRQEEALRQRLRATGVSVTRSGDQLILNMPGNVTFATDSAAVESNFYPVLDSVALVLKEYNKTYVDVIGHTDSTGSEAYNQLLSQRRAQAVADYLRGQGVESQRLLVTGRGETMPIASNETAAGRQQNRRVEIVLTPIT